MHEIGPTSFQLVKGMENIKVAQVAAGRTFSLARTVDGRVYAWGANQLGVLYAFDSFFVFVFLTNFLFISTNRLII